MIEYITKSQLLQREYWSTGTVNKLLKKPDEIERHTNGSVKRILFLVSRVKEAEKTEVFAKRMLRVEEYRKEQAALAQKDREEEEAFKKLCWNALLEDFKEITVPEFGEFEQVYSVCKQCLTKFDNTIKNSGRMWHPFVKERVHALCLTIANQRPDLAFDAGYFWHQEEQKIKNWGDECY